MKNKTNLKKIKVYGLFKKKDVEIEFKNSVKILISENGLGKTSILNIIVGIFTKNINILKEIEFEKIDIEFYEEEVITIKKLEILKYKHPYKMFLAKVERILGRESPNLKYYFRNLVEENVSIDEILDKLRIRTDFRLMERIERARRIYLDDFDLTLKNYEYNDDEIDILLNKKNFDIEYFPTYRRIEKENFDGVFNGNNYDGINFGMKDVNKKITQLTEEIKKETYKDFLEMNNEILMDIIEEKASKREFTKDEISSISSVMPIILQRINNSTIEKRQSEIVRQITKIIKNPPKEESKFLPYYLWKMFMIYKKQEEKEKRIDSFIEICNKYLTNKKFIYIAESPRVEIRDEMNKVIPLSLLSSGEKQIVSIFARLYLEEKEDLMIVIDEPELSISMKWQKMLLPDILASNKCKLLLVTTHSPFIFDNNLDSYAEALQDSIKPYQTGDKSEY